VAITSKIIASSSNKLGGIVVSIFSMVFYHFYQH
jgi:hypothetical protein